MVRARKQRWRNGAKNGCTRMGDGDATNERRRTALDVAVAGS